MRIAQIAPLFESVPPVKYGGTERIVSYLTEELVARGHDVTLFASGDSKTTARLISPVQNGLRLGFGYDQCTIPHTLMFEEVRRRSHEFDILHFHTEFLHFFLARLLKRPNVTTMHGRLDLPHFDSMLREYRDLPLISISNAQRSAAPWASWLGTVYHGLPRDLTSFSGKEGSYFAFLGRMSPDKGPACAIEIANRAGVYLKMAAKVDPTEKVYFEECIVPLLKNSPNVEFIGEVGDSEKFEFLRNAKALLFPIDWPEPFGLVLIEAMACGTPVIAFRRGSVSEIVRDGVSGYVVDTVEEAVENVLRISEIDRAGCRKEWEERFTIDVCVDAYVELYEQVLKSRNLAKVG